MNISQPSTSKDCVTVDEHYINDDDNDALTTNIRDEEDNILNKIANAEELFDKKFMELSEYEKQIFLDMAYTDGLVVCAKGISYYNVLINLLCVYCDPGNLILVINCPDYEEKYFRSKLEGCDIHEVSTTAAERERVYLQGGIQFISTRILVVDLLKKRVPIELITGVFVLRAHDIIESCQEAFALRLYRQSNKTGFIKGFSSSPESFTYGYGHVEKVMRNLFIKNLYIWPRFHVLIQKSLKLYEPQVIELHVPMTTKMTLIQTQILDLMNYLVKEIKRINRYVDMQEITVENCVTKKFHKILQSQLDCVWHQLSSHTKLLISDLKVLRSLMISTIYNDSVSLYGLMKKYRTKEYAMNNSGWTLLDAAEQMFKTTKERVFNDSDEFEPESCPKWQILSEILRVEIPNEIRTFMKNQKHKESVKVLILCQDSRTCYQLNQYLIQGPERYLFYTALKHDIQITNISERFKMIKESDNNSINIHKMQNYLSKPRMENTPKPTNTIKSMFFEKTDKDVSTTTTTTSNEPIKQKGFLKDRLAKRKLEAEEAELGKEENDCENNVNELDDLTMITKDDSNDNDLFRESYILTINESHEFINAKDDESNSVNRTQYEFESFAEMENLDITAAINNIDKIAKPILCIQTFKSGDDGLLALEKTLNEMDPQYIVMYHCNVTAIRQIEVYETKMKRMQEKRLKVFFIIHSETVEEQSYLTNLRREKQAFELLIETKSKMVVPEYQDGKSDESLLMLQKTPDKINTRKAGGQDEVTATPIMPKIIVDMREFRSDLPCLIHKRGIEVVPVTISIGDYILTPEICVERKSISDLIGSLNSGRLYNQCVQMTRHYAKPILLIEFDQNKPFHLQGHYMISGESTSNVDITQKLQLLTMYFPKLRLVWSPSPYATAQLFEELKYDKIEPDPIKAAAIGTDDAKDLEIIVDQINSNIYDFLLRLPGINSRNINKIIRKVKNLKELLKMDEKQLTELLGNETNAKMLLEILHGTHKPVKLDGIEKQFLSKYKRCRGGGGRRF